MSGFWCVIVVSGELDDRFGDAFAGLSVRAANGNTELTGSLRDQSQLLGVMRELFDLGLDIESMSARLGPHDSGDLAGWTETPDLACRPDDPFPVESEPTGGSDDMAAP